MVPVRGYAKGGDTENVEFVGIAAWFSRSATRADRGSRRPHGDIGL